MSRGTVAPPAQTPPAPPAQAAPPPGGRAPATAPAQGTPPRARARTALDGTPGRMRLLGIVAALAAAVVGIVGATSLWSSAGALNRAGDNTEQVVRIQGIYADLVRADADATAAFLVGGLENPDRRADYDRSVRQVATGIADAAQAQPADRAALGELNTQVQTYAANIEQARAYNRQGQPVGAQYLSNASTTLRGQILPIVTELVTANQKRADAEFTASSRLVAVVVVGLLGLAVLVLVMVWLARRTHRYLNPSMFVGTLVVLVAIGIGIVTLSAVAGQVQGVRSTDYDRTVAIAQARSAAYDAKSNESLTLIARGSGDRFETAWTDSSTKVPNLLAKLDGGTRSTLLREWTSYTTVHQAIRDADKAGKWDEAVNRAVGPGADTSNATFSTFAADATTTLDTLRQSTQDGLRSPVGAVTVAGWVLLVLCVAAALLVLRGIGQRMEEYR